jgi:hypothetical protein
MDGRKNLEAKGCDVRSLGRSRPGFDICHPGMTLSAGCVEIPREKLGRIRQKASNVYRTRFDSFDTEQQNLRGRNVSFQPERFVEKPHGHDYTASRLRNTAGILSLGLAAHWTHKENEKRRQQTKCKNGEFAKILTQLGDVVNEAQRSGMFHHLTPKDMRSIIGLPEDLKGGRLLTRLLFTATEHPQAPLQNADL